MNDLALVLENGARTAEFIRFDCLMHYDQKRVAIFNSAQIQ